MFSCVSSMGNIYVFLVCFPEETCLFSKRKQAGFPRVFPEESGEFSIGKQVCFPCLFPEETGVLSRRNWCVLSCVSRRNRCVFHGKQVCFPEETHMCVSKGISFVSQCVAGENGRVYRVFAWETQRFPMCFQENK